MFKHNNKAENAFCFSISVHDLIVYRKPFLKERTSDDSTHADSIINLLTELGMCGHCVSLLNIHTHHGRVFFMFEPPFIPLESPVQLIILSYNNFGVQEPPSPSEFLMTFQGEGIDIYIFIFSNCIFVSQ